MDEFSHALTSEIKRKNQYNSTLSEAVVTAVNPDGTYDLQYKGNSGIMKSVELTGNGQLQIGDGVITGYIDGQKQMPKIFFQGQPVTANPLKASVESRSGNSSSVNNITNTSGNLFVNPSSQNTFTLQDTVNFSIPSANYLYVYSTVVNGVLVIVQQPNGTGENYVVQGIDLGSQNQGVLWTLNITSISPFLTTVGDTNSAYLIFWGSSQIQAISINPQNGVVNWNQSIVGNIVSNINNVNNLTNISVMVNGGVVEIYGFYVENTTNFVYQLANKEYYYVLYSIVLSFSSTGSSVKTAQPINYSSPSKSYYFGTSMNTSQIYFDGTNFYQVVVGWVPDSQQLYTSANPSAFSFSKSSGGYDYYTATASPASFSFNPDILFTQTAPNSYVFEADPPAYGGYDKTTYTGWLVAPNVFYDSYMSFPVGDIPTSALWSGQEYISFQPGAIKQIQGHWEIWLITASPANISASVIYKTASGVSSNSSDVIFLGWDSMEGLNVYIKSSVHPVPVPTTPNQMGTIISDSNVVVTPEYTGYTSVNPYDVVESYYVSLNPTVVISVLPRSSNNSLNSIPGPYSGRTSVYNYKTQSSGFFSLPASDLGISFISSDLNTVWTNSIFGSAVNSYYTPLFFTESAFCFYVSFPNTGMSVIYVIDIDSGNVIFSQPYFNVLYATMLDNGLIVVLYQNISDAGNQFQVDIWK